MKATVREYTQMARGTEFNSVASIVITTSDGSVFTLSDSGKGLKIHVMDGSVRVSPINTNLISVEQVSDGE